MPGGSFTWTGTFGTEEQRITTTLEGEETIDVAGERLQGCRHYRTTTVLPKETGDVERSYQAWLCPDVGAVRTVESAPDLGVLLEEELVGFRSPGRRLGAVVDPPSEQATAHPGDTPGVDDARTGAVPEATVDLSRVAWTDARKAGVKFPPVGRRAWWSWPSRTAPSPPSTRRRVRSGGG